MILALTPAPLRISGESQPFARSLFAAAQKAWNIVAPQVRRFECQEIEIPAMSEEPAEVSILWWLRSDREDCPRSLQSLTLLRWLVELHNGLLDVAVECAETHDAIAEPVCLADALRPYFFHYQPGSSTSTNLETRFQTDRLLEKLLILVTERKNIQDKQTQAK